MRWLCFIQHVFSQAIFSRDIETFHFHHVFIYNFQFFLYLLTS